MIRIECPKDLNQFVLDEPLFENTFSEKECEQRKLYGDCFHCFASAIAKRDKALREKFGREFCDCSGDDSAQDFPAGPKNLCSGETELDDYEPESDSRVMYELFPDENGVFHLHKPEYDVTILCESEEEQKKAINSLTEMARVKKETALTEAEKIICRQYLEGLDKLGTCNEYKLLMKLIDGVALKEPCKSSESEG